MNEAGNIEHISAEPVPSDIERRARQTLWIIDHNAPHVINAMKEYAPKTWASMLADLRAMQAAKQ